MRVRPLHDRILVRRLEEGEQTIGGIIIPDTAREKPQQGEILAVGNGKLNDQGRRVPLEVKVGDRILFDKYSQEIALEGEEYLILRQEEVLAVLGGGRTTRKTTTKKRFFTGLSTAPEAAENDPDPAMIGLAWRSPI